MGRENEMMVKGKKKEEYENVWKGKGWERREREKLVEYGGRECYITTLQTNSKLQTVSQSECDLLKINKLINQSFSQSVNHFRSGSNVHENK